MQLSDAHALAQGCDKQFFDKKSLRSSKKYAGVGIEPTTLGSAA